MGKSEANLQQQQQQQQQRQTQEAQNSSGLICPRCSVVFRKIGKELSFRCVAVLILSFSILLSGIFWIPHYYANSSQFDAKEEIKLSGMSTFPSLFLSLLCFLLHFTLIIHFFF
ncbi:hypothetical protein C1H46_045156 [Malus baccata]|uniref:Uncharacterized protein n=1 Tax=Malus baccata TaxID=106549 RepID=A0A540K511_MALBA|nr:hypothetical protein C1H46_045156 [Malus baccata]